MNYSKYLLEIAFKGTAYSGWQIQPDKITVQQVINEKLSYLYKQDVSVRGVGRTDSGVHAVGMTAAFNLPDRPNIPADKVKIALNSILPGDIYIRNVYIKENPDFDARFDAVGKAYTYVLAEKDPGPFINDYCWKVPYKFDKKKIVEGSKYLIGEHDFSSFAVAISKNKKNPIRQIYRINVDTFEEFTCITFVGKSFLYKMVRSLAGTLVQCAEKRKSSSEVKTILDAKARAKGYKTAPSQGLFLMEVFYDEKKMDEFKLKRLPFQYMM